MAFITLSTALGLYLGLQYLLPCVAPFVVALIIARLIEPAVRLLSRHGIRRELASGLCTLVLIALLIFGLWSALIYGASELGSLSGNIPRLLYGAGELISSVRQKIREYTDALPPEMGAWIDSSIGSLASFFATMPTLISERIIALLSGIATAMPTILLFCITCALGIYFISASYPSVQCFFDTKLPQPWQSRRLAINSSLHFTVFRYIRAQAILTLITFFELLLAFFLLRIENALVLALVVSLVDALPILGAGAVLIPWACFSLLLSDIGTGVGLLIIWAVITVMRNCFQAKLLGDQLGLHPLLTLASIYIGWKLAAVWGMILFPMVALLLKQFFTHEMKGGLACE